MTTPVDERPPGRVGESIPVSCSACGTAIDALRAGHVAIFSSELHFFCDHAVCRARYLGETPVVPATAEAPASSAPLDPMLEAVVPPVRAPAPSATDEYVPPRLDVDDRDDFVEAISPPVEVIGPTMIEATPERREIGQLLVSLALVAGILTVALELAEPTRLLAVARLGLVAVGVAALLGRALTAPADVARPHWLVVLLAPLYAGLVAGWAAWAGPAPSASYAAFVAGTVLSAAAVNAWAVAVVEARLSVARLWVMTSLSGVARHVDGFPTAIATKELVADVNVGEHVLVEEGERSVVDLEVVEGEAEIRPWPGAQASFIRGVGETVVAGAEVLQGQVRGRVLHTGDDRVFAGPMTVDALRPDAHARLPWLMRRFAERVAPVIAVLAGMISWLVGTGGALDHALVVVGVYAAFANLATASLVAMAVGRGVSDALERGIVFRGAAPWDAAGRVNTAVFCARGTLLRGEPQVVEIEPLELPAGKAVDGDELLVLAGSALVSQEEPMALAIRRAARERKLTLQPMRNTRGHELRGVSALSSTGETIAVGDPAFLVEQRISVALAEDSIASFERLGRTVLLVARGGRLVGVIALQDGLRSGARAAVQHLLDARIEPVLMSSDPLETCHALGRTLDIEHVRPAIPAQETGTEVSRLREAGANVAVLGHSPHDDLALEAAAVPVVLGAGAQSREPFAATLIADDVRDAALALAIAARTRQQAVAVATLVLVPAAVGALVVSLGIVAAAYAPIAQVLGALTAVAHLRANDAQRRG